MPASSDACPYTLHHLYDLLQGHHAGIARCSHSERPMGSAAFYRPLRIFAREKAIDQARSERISSTDTIKDFEIFAILRLVKLAIAVTDGSPVIAGSSLGFAQCSGNHLKRVVFHYGRDHLFEALGINL